MIYGLYQSAAGMLTSEYAQGVTANNLANADTVGFKRDVAVFAERLRADRAGRRDGPSAEGLGGLTGGTWLGRTETDHGEGPHTPTDNPLDAALAGPGFFIVESGGRPLATRDGRMLMTPDGSIVAASDGAPVLGRGGAPLHVNPYGGTPTFDDSGHVLQRGAIVGELGLVDFADYGGLHKVGAGRFDPGQTPAIEARPVVRGGFIEQSGVEPTTELVNMVETARAYQMNAQMISLQDQTLGRLFSVVSR